MKKKDLKSIVNNLCHSLSILKDNDITDSILRARLSEYITAYKLSNRNFTVETGSKRKVKQADIYLTDVDIKIEVKSGVYREYNGIDFAGASFGIGKQIKNKKFDYCVFLTFKNDNSVYPKEIFIFNIDELEEIALKNKLKKKWADHKTNTCLLMKCKSFSNYNLFLESYPEYKTDIEYKLNRCPEKYLNKWSKIKKRN